MADLNSVDGCWAASLGNCKGKLSREHYVSACLFPSGKVIVKGFDWCRDEQKTIGLQSLTRNILCEHHNNTLSELDEAMLAFFNVLRDSGRLMDVRSKLGLKTWTMKHFEVDSRLLERWFLKTLINLNFRQALRFGDSGVEAGEPPRELVQIAFGQSKFEKFAGMYIATRTGEQIVGLEGVSINTFIERDALIGAEFKVCGHRFVLSIVSEEVHEFMGSQLSHQQMNFVFRVPDKQGRMVRSHSVHIRHMD